MAGGYLLVCSLLEKCGHFWKNGRFSGRIWPYWGNTTWADMAGLGSITRSNQVRRCLVGVPCEGNAILSFSYATYAPDPSITLKFSSFNYNVHEYLFFQITKAFITKAI